MGYLYLFYVYEYSSSQWTTGKHDAVRPSAWTDTSQSGKVRTLTAQRCYIGLVAVGVQEQAEDILVPPLLRNCSILNDISFSWSLSPLQNSGPCNSFYCLGHSKNVYDDTEQSWLPVMLEDASTVSTRLSTVPGRHAQVTVRRLGQIAWRSTLDWSFLIIFLQRHKLWTMWYIYNDK